MKCKNTNFSRVVVFLGSARPLPFPPPSLPSLPLPLPLLSSAAAAKVWASSPSPPFPAALPSLPLFPPLERLQHTQTHTRAHTHPHPPPPRHHLTASANYRAGPRTPDQEMEEGRAAAGQLRARGPSAGTAPPPRAAAAWRGSAPRPLLTGIPGSSRPPTRAASSSRGVKRDKTNPALTVSHPPRPPQHFLCLRSPVGECRKRGEEAERSPAA